MKILFNNDIVEVQIAKLRKIKYGDTHKRSPIVCFHPSQAQNVHIMS